ncbi:hypothetical protein SHK09_07865 [Polaribacter sp. PL03]|nr:hypothetical protein [Polaribacter sp. PL03]
MCTLLFFCCSQSLDFDQIEDYAIKPSITSSLTFFTIDATSFASAFGVPIITEISETSDFKLFENNFVKNNLVQLDFDIQVVNKFNRDFTMKILLLDEDDNLIYQLKDLNITANNLDFKQREEIVVATNSNVINFTRIEITLSLDDKTTPINASDIGEIEFKSAATIHLEKPL